MCHLIMALVVRWKIPQFFSWSCSNGMTQIWICWSHFWCMDGSHNRSPLCFTGVVSCAPTMDADIRKPIVVRDRFNDVFVWINCLELLDSRCKTCSTRALLPHWQRWFSPFPNNHTHAYGLIPFLEWTDSHFPRML